jgi:hypothetical protein
MPFHLKGMLIIVLLVAIAAFVIWAPWQDDHEGMPDDVFAEYEGEWQGSFFSYEIDGVSRESIRRHITMESINPDSQVGEILLLDADDDIIARDSVFHLRRGDTLYAVHRYEGGRRSLDRGYWADNQIFWRSFDDFGRVAHAYRERVKDDLWEIDGFTRTDKGQYLLQYGRALRR